MAAHHGRQPRSHPTRLSSCRPTRAARVGTTTSWRWTRVTRPGTRRSSAASPCWPPGTAAAASPTSPNPTTMGRCIRTSTRSSSSRATRSSPGTTAGSGTPATWVGRPSRGIGPISAPRSASRSFTAALPWTSAIWPEGHRTMAPPALCRGVLWPRRGLRCSMAMGYRPR